jgi:alpha-beta hydrolase superfamily lysophospholipase
MRTRREARGASGWEAAGGRRKARYLIACLLLLAGRAKAQESDAGVLRLHQGALEVGREVFRETGRVLEATTTIPLLNARIVSRIERTEAGRPAHVEERVYTLRTDSLQRTYTATQDGDTLRMTLTPTGGAPRAWSRAYAPDEIAVDQSLAPILRLLQRAPHQDRSWTLFVPNVDTVAEMRVTWRGDTADVTLGPQVFLAVLGADGRVQTADFPVGRVHYERFTGTDLPPLSGQTRPAPDYSAPAGAAWTAEEVRVPVRPVAGDTFSLGCTLTKPTAGGPRFPAAITLTGSGLQDRDENLWPLLRDYRLYRQVAERLARAGIAVLRCDDQGFGASRGPVDSATMTDFAADAAAQLAWLRARADIDPAKLAVIGHSEGGIVGPMVAAADPRLAALVMMAGTGKTMELVIRDQFVYPVEHAQGLTDQQRAAARAQALRAAEDLASSPIPYVRQARWYDPLPTARRVRSPVLILQGAVDRQVSAGQADTLAAAIRAAGNRDVTVRTFDRLNHLFLVSPSGTGAADEYASLNDAAVPNEVLDVLADWLAWRLVRRSR